MVETKSKETQALCLSPTRELAEQSRHVVMAFGDLMNVRCHACIGGKSVGDDIRTLEAGIQIVSGTPGRVYDMIKRNVLKTKAIKMLVIDEADEMLSKGFKDQIYDIYRYLPPKTQVRPCFRVCCGLVLCAGVAVPVWRVAHLSPPGDPDRLGVGHASSRRLGHDHQVYVRPDPHPCEAR